MVEFISEKSVEGPNTVFRVWRGDHNLPTCQVVGHFYEFNKTLIETQQLQNSRAINR
jgi:hypothetical protein